MDIETAANLGEALSGIAILFTLLFSLRQMKYWNENRRYEIGRDIASHLADPDPTRILCHDDEIA